MSEKTEIFGKIISARLSAACETGSDSHVFSGWWQAGPTETDRRTNSPLSPTACRGLAITRRIHWSHNARVPKKELPEVDSVVKICKEYVRFLWCQFSISISMHLPSKLGSFRLKKAGFQWFPGFHFKDVALGIAEVFKESLDAPQWSQRQPSSSRSKTTKKKNCPVRHLGISVGKIETHREPGRCQRWMKWGYR